MSFNAKAMMFRIAERMLMLEQKLGSPPKGFRLMGRKIYGRLVPVKPNGMRKIIKYEIAKAKVRNMGKRQHEKELTSARKTAKWARSFARHEPERFEATYTHLF